jgi:hypothetical protein
MARTLRVIPNKFSFIHPEHGPQGACMQDPNEHARGSTGPLVRYVGARLDPKRTVITERRDGTEKGRPLDHRQSKQTTVYVFSDDPVTLPHTKYYLDRLHEGTLVPADEETLANAGGKTRVRFTSMEQAEAAARAQFDAGRGIDGAFDKLMERVVGKPATPAKKTPAKGKKPAKPKRNKEAEA